MTLEEIYHYMDAGVRFFVLLKPKAPAPVGPVLTRFQGRSSIPDGNVIVPFVLASGLLPLDSRSKFSKLVSKGKVLIYGLLFRCKSDF